MNILTEPNKSGKTEQGPNKKSGWKRRKVGEGDGNTGKRKGKPAPMWSRLINLN